MIVVTQRGEIVAVHLADELPVGLFNYEFRESTNFVKILYRICISRRVLNEFIYHCDTEVQTEEWTKNDCDITSDHGIHDKILFQLSFINWKISSKVFEYFVRNITMNILCTEFQNLQYYILVKSFYERVSVIKRYSRIIKMFCAKRIIYSR